MSDVEELIRIVNSKYFADGLEGRMRDVFTNLLNLGYLGKLFSSTSSCTENGSYPVDLSVIMEESPTQKNIDRGYSTGDKLIAKYVRKELKTQLIAELMEELEKEIETNV